MIKIFTGKENFFAQFGEQNFFGGPDNQFPFDRVFQQFDLPADC